MDKIRVFIADDNREVVLVVSETLKQYPNIDIVGTAFNGKETLRVLKSQEVDVLLLDIFMPEVDGLDVLKELSKGEYVRPNKIIMFTAFTSRNVMNQAARYGADFFILKPFDANKIIQTIHELFEEDEMDEDFKISLIDVDKTIAKYLDELGFPSSITGYKYLKDCAIFVFENIELLGSITKSLYPQIAKKYDVTPASVERAMRHAIESVWTKADLQMLDDFYTSSYSLKGKPTNSDFIGILVQKLKDEIKGL